MKNQYSHINFDRFSDVPEEKLTRDEKERLLEDFYQNAGIHYVNQKKKHHWHSVAAVAACLIICLTITPIGESAWAATKQALMGIGEFLGMVKQDNYATVIDQSKTKNGTTVTLNDAIGSDNKLRVSVTVTRDDGKVLGTSKVSIGDYAINGMNWRNGLEATGTGSYGSKRAKDGGIYFIGVSFVHYEMPLNPIIDMTIWAGDEKFKFSFVLENEAFKTATKTIGIDKTIDYVGEKITFEDMIITPIDQKITVKAPEGFFEMNGKYGYDFCELALYGKDNFGNDIVFNAEPFDGTMVAANRNEDETGTYEPDPDVSWYKLTVYDTGGEAPVAISDEFTVKVKK